MPSPSLQVFQYAVLTDANGVRSAVGSMVDSANLTTSFGGEVDRRVYTLASAAVTTAWTAGTGPLSAFNFLWIRANVDDVMIELITDNNNGVGDERLTMRLKKNLAFVLGDDTSYANYTTGFAGGTLDVIDQLKISNLGSGDAVVEVVIAQ